MELHDLQYCLAVARQKSFSRAAESIPVSVASVSETVKSLETELGVLLFERTTRSVRLTPAGELLVEHASKVLAQIETMLSELSAYRRACEEGVVLGVIPGTPAHNFPDFLTQFRRSYPDVVLRILEGNNHQLLQALRSHDIEISFHAGYPDDHPQDIDAREITREQMGIALAPGHPMASDDCVALHMLDDMPMVSTSPGYAYHEIGREVCRRAGIRPRIVLETAVIDTLCGAVRSGLGFAFMSRERALAAGLSFVKCIPAPLERVLSLWWMRDRPVKPAASLLRQNIFSSRDWFTG